MDKNIQIIEEGKRDKRGAISDLENLYIHMVKYRMVRYNQDSDWVDTIYKCIISLSDVIYNNKNIRNELESKLNSCLSKGIKNAKIQCMPYNDNIDETEVYKVIQEDLNDNFDWKNIDQILNPIVMSRWLYKHRALNAFKAKSVLEKLHKRFNY